MQASQPLDVHIAFEAGQDQPQRIALLRAQPLAVLAVDQHRIVEAFFDRDASSQRGGIGSFRDNPFGAGLQASLLQHEFQIYPGPFRAAQEPHEVGSGLAIGLLVAGIAGALEKVDARLRREAPDVLHREDHWTFHQAMQHQAMLRRIDGGNPGVMTLIEQSIWRDDAIEILQGRAA